MVMSATSKENPAEISFPSQREQGSKSHTGTFKVHNKNNIES